MEEWPFLNASILSSAKQVSWQLLKMHDGDIAFLPLAITEAGQVRRGTQFQRVFRPWPSAVEMPLHVCLWPTPPTWARGSDFLAFPLQLPVTPAVCPSETLCVSGCEMSPEPQGNQCFMAAGAPLCQLADQRYMDADLHECSDWACDGV